MYGGYLQEMMRWRIRRIEAGLRLASPGPGFGEFPGSFHRKCIQGSSPVRRGERVPAAVARPSAVPSAATSHPVAAPPWRPQNKRTISGHAMVIEAEELLAMPDHADAERQQPDT
jgi:hypothetical protein